MIPTLAFSDVTIASTQTFPANNHAAPISRLQQVPFWSAISISAALSLQLSLLRAKPFEKVSSQSRLHRNCPPACARIDM